MRNTDFCLEAGLSIGSGQENHGFFVNESKNNRLVVFFRKKCRKNVFENAGSSIGSGPEFDNPSARAIFVMLWSSTHM